MGRMGPPLIIRYLSLATRIGDIWLASTPRGVFRVHFGNLDVESLEDCFQGLNSVRFERGGMIVEEAARQILRYLEGKLRKFSVKLDLA